ncbi:MAG: hypothetical protein WCD76_14400, partial [Pyrinomonadaceae bacterium]
MTPKHSSPALVALISIFVIALCAAPLQAKKPAHAAVAKKSAREKTHAGKQKASARETRADKHRDERAAKNERRGGRADKRDRKAERADARKDTRRVSRRERLLE